MKIKKSQLRRVILEAKKLMTEEPADYYREYKAGLISYEEYKQLVKNYERISGFDEPRATPQQQSVAALLRREFGDRDRFISSVISQLDYGRSLSDKQKKVVRQKLYRRGKRDLADKLR